MTDKTVSACECICHTFTLPIKGDPTHHCCNAPPNTPPTETHNKVYNQDCLEAMKKMPDKFFDLAIVDPPYGIGISKRSGSIGQKKGQGVLTKYVSKNWDENIPNKEYFDELFRVSKDQIIWGGNYFAPYLPSAKGWIVWDKRQPEGVSFAMAELAFCSINRSVKMFSCSRAFIGNKVANNPYLAKKWVKIHPTQKPVVLYRWLLRNYAKKGDLILDTHVGSGSSRIAAFDLGFHFTGYEIDNYIYNAQEHRYFEYCKNPGLDVSAKDLQEKLL